MKKLFVLSIYLFVVVSLYSNPLGKDSLLIKMSTTRLGISSFDTLIKLEIENVLYDTLIFIPDIYVEGLTGNSVAWRTQVNSYAPNILFLLDKNKNLEYGTGIFVVNFYDFPSMIELAPSKRKTIYINISQFYPYLREKIFEVNYLICFAKKKILDETVRHFYLHRWDEFVNSLSDKDSIYANLVIADSVKIYSRFFDKFPNRDSTVNLIQKNFDIEKRYEP